MRLSVTRESTFTVKNKVHYTLYVLAFNVIKNNLRKASNSGQKIIIMYTKMCNFYGYATAL